VEKKEKTIEDRLHKLQVTLARESFANRAIELALSNNGYIDLAEIYDQLSSAVGEYEAELITGDVSKPTLNE
jgi:uncharacterized protein with PhoU and TrkA domain